MTFVDTSALLAFLDRDATHHEDVIESMAAVLAAGTPVTHNYVLIETEALVHRRLGSRVVRRLFDDLVPALDIRWVDQLLHDASVAAHLRDLRRRSSLVDQVSFELMRRERMGVAVALDRHFEREGFEVMPRFRRS